MLLERIRLFLKPEPREPMPTFAQELDRNATAILKAGLIIGSFAWLPYMILDHELNPARYDIMALRIGLTILCIALFIYSKISTFKYKHSAATVVFIGYIILVTAYITGSVKVPQIYFAGLVLVLFLLLFAYVSILWVLGILLSTAGVFIATLAVHHPTIFQGDGAYMVGDFASSIVILLVLLVLTARNRYQSWQQGLLASSAQTASDAILLKILPQTVAEELKEKGSVEPLFYDSVTILFTDFVAFTRIASTMLPDELIEELNRVFSQFDNIAKKFGIEKIKTIGDSYMAAAGLPQINNTHPVDACLAALEMRVFIQEVNKIRELAGHEAFLDIRIGIHSGSVMAGVVGESKFAYDIFGDAVNVASRMESGGQPGRINISHETHNIVKQWFDCESRGSIQVKNRGAVEMYFLNRLKEEFSRDNEGLVANEIFWGTYERLKNDGFL